MSVTLILDNTVLSFNGGVWTQTPPGLWYNGSALFSSKALPNSTDFLHVNFVGTSISWVGVTPSADTSTSFLVDIDTTNTNVSASYPQSEVGCTWWTSPPLSDVASGHAMFLYNLEQIILDYMLVTAGTQTNFAGQTIFMDDANPEITWLGQWTTATDYTIATGAYNVLPAGNGTHTSTNVGDSFSFTFAGTAISVYGVMSYGSSGSINAIFSIDGESSTPRSFSANTTAINGLTNATNYQLFSTTNLSPGEHTLRVNVTGMSGNLPFIVDYLTYVPTFFSLGSKPDFTGQPGIGSSNPDSTSSNSSSNGSSGSGSSGSSGSNGTSTGNDTSSSGSSKTPVGAIAGGIIGALAVVALLLGAFIYLRRRRRQSQPAYWQQSEDKLIPQPYHDIPNPNAYPMKHIPQASFSGDSRGDVISWSGSPAGTLSISQMTAAQKQAELRRRVEEINSLMQQMDGEGSGRSSTSAAERTIPSHNELQARIDMLTRENEMLMASVPPPLYEENSPESSDVVGGDEVPRVHNVRPRAEKDRMIGLHVRS